MERDRTHRKYASIAPDYDQRWRSYIRVSIQETLQRIHLKPGMKVLDVGCGTGVLLAEVSTRQPRAHLTGVDQSSAMLQLARDRLDRRADLHVATAESLPFEDNRFDVVCCSNMLHYIRNKPAVLQEMGRVLKPAGAVVVTDWCRDYLTIRGQDLISRVFSRTYSRSLTGRECVSLLTGAGFCAPRVETYRISPLWGLMTAIARN